MKPTQLPTLLIPTRDSMLASVHDIVAARHRHAELTARMEQEIATLQQRYQQQLAPLAREIESKQTGVQLFCQQHRATEFPGGKKSIDLGLAIIGFRETPLRVEKTRSRDTWDAIAARIATLTARDKSGALIFNGEDYLTPREPTLAKTTLLQNRTKIPASILKTAGLRFTSDELFYLTPKAQSPALPQAA